MKQQILLGTGSPPGPPPRTAGVGAAQIASMWLPPVETRALSTHKLRICVQMHGDQIRFVVECMAS